MLCNSPVVREHQERDAHPAVSPAVHYETNPPQPASSPPHEYMKHAEEREAELRDSSPA